MTGPMGDRGEPGLTLSRASMWATFAGGILSGLAILIGGVFWAGGKADSILTTVNQDHDTISRIGSFVREDHEDIKIIANAEHVTLPTDTKTTTNDP